MIKGVFDKAANKQYNDAIPNYDVNDGVDIVKCDNTVCQYRDVEKGICLFETCIYNQLSILFHNKFTYKCKICRNIQTVEFKEYEHPVLDYNPFICETCISKLRNLVEGEV